MNLIVCIDDMGGMSFNGRRQSKDKAVIADIKAMCYGKRLYMNPYSAKNFYDCQFLMVSDDPLSDAEIGDWCFAENIPVTGCQNVEKLIIYRWNRLYPADNYLGIDLKNWRLISSRDAEGSSHEKLTKEIYVK